VRGPHRGSRIHFSVLNALNIRVEQLKWDIIQSQKRLKLDADGRTLCKCSSSFKKFYKRVGLCGKCFPYQCSRIPFGIARNTAQYERLVEQGIIEQVWNDIGRTVCSAVVWNLIRFKSFTSLVISLLWDMGRLLFWLRRNSTLFLYWSRKYCSHRSSYSLWRASLSAELEDMIGSRFIRAPLSSCSIWLNRVEIGVRCGMGRSGMSSALCQHLDRQVLTLLYACNLSTCVRLRMPSANATGSIPSLAYICFYLDAAISICSYPCSRRDLTKSNSAETQQKQIPHQIVSGNTEVSETNVAFDSLCFNFPDSHQITLEPLRHRQKSLCTTTQMTTHCESSRSRKTKTLIG